MDIKLRARLRAYGKLDNSLPHPTVADAGKFVGVNTEGKYTLFANASEQHIDDLIAENNDIEIDSAKKSLIDSMFK